MEVLVAMAVMSIGLLGVAGLTTTILIGNTSSRNITTATVLAQQKLEVVQRVGYASTNTTTFPTAAETIAVGTVSFSRTTTISDNTPASNMKTVTVVVSWDSGVRSVNMSNIISQQ
jgi:type IV pilus assembly protein PilV